LPSGRNAGQPTCVVLSPASAVAGTPPDAFTRRIGSLSPPSNRITPSRPHEPSAPVGASQITCGGPPATAIFLSLPFDMNPRKRLSGDQNGVRVSSVPGSGFAVSELSGRSQIMVRLSESTAANARMRPSGEMRGMLSGVTPEGIGIVKRICSRSSGRPPAPPRSARNAAAATATPATAHATGSRPRRFDAACASAGAATPDCEAGCAIQVSWSLASSASRRGTRGSATRARGAPSGRRS
jgi:hypothetical protein